MSKLVVNTTKKSGFTYHFPELDATLHYHKLTVLERQRLLLSHLKNGKLPTDAVAEIAYQAMEQMIDDWEGVEDEHGDKLEYNVKYIRGMEFDSVMQFVDDVIFADMEEFRIAKDRLIKRSDSNKGEKSEIKN